MMIDKKCWNELMRVKALVWFGLNHNCGIGARVHVQEAS
jgi:hypothetical protein